MKFLLQVRTCVLTAFRSKTLFLLFDLLVLFGLNGCKIEFEANTMIRPDGSVVRTIRYVAYEDSDKEELKTQYVLPPGGTWKIKKITKYNWYTKKECEGTIHIYSVTEKYAPGELIPSDHVRLGKIEGSIGRNETSLSVQDYFFVKFFNFKETFSDVASKERSITAAKRLYPVLIEQFACSLASRLNGLSTVQVSKVLKSMFDPWFERFIESLHTGDEDFFETYEKELNEIFEKDRLVAYLTEKLPSPSEEQAEPWRETIADAYDEMGKSVESLWENKEFEEAFFGVYGFTLFQSYGFKETLVLPGKILSTNAESRQANILTWEFDETDFRLEDYVLNARSRLINTSRIAWAMGFIILVLVSVGGILVRRSWRQT